MIFSQENLEVQNLKETLIKDKQLYEINLNLIIEEIRKDSIALTELTIENKSYLTELNKFKVSDNNLKVYNNLIQKKLFQPIDFLNKKTKKFSRSLNEQFNLNLLDNYFVENQTLYYYFVDSNYKASILKSIGLDSKNYKNFLRLDIKEVYSPKNMTSNQFLYNLTGINNNYFTLTEKIDSLKAKIKKLNENLIEKGQKKKLTIEEYKTKERVTENKIKLIEQEIKNEIIAQENLKKYPCKSINGVDIYLGPVLEKSFRNGDIIREARTPGEWSDFIKNKIPAFRYEDFDSKNSSKDLIYNYFAFSDKREIAPIGFHKLNILDFIYIDGQNVGEFKKVTVDCYCGDGFTSEGWVACPNCRTWTENHRRNYKCTQCSNSGFEGRIFKSKTICLTCKGLKKYVTDKCELCEKKDLKLLIANDFSKFDYVVNNLDGDEELFYKCQFPFAKIEFDKDQVRIQDYGYYTSRKDEVINGNYRFILCRDRKNKILASNTLDFNELEIMNTFLDVTKFKNGDNIKYIEDNVEWELALRDGIPAYCYFNNDKSSRNCFYNVHAINDKRGLIPEGWRSITGQDIRYIEFIKGKKFDFENNTCPVNKPLGFRDDLGKFNVYNDYGINYINFKDKDFNTRGGYILCVKEKNPKNFNVIIPESENPFGSGGFGGRGKGDLGKDTELDDNVSGDGDKSIGSATIEDELKSQSTDRLDTLDFSTEGKRKRVVDLVICKSSRLTITNASELFFRIFRIKEISRAKLSSKKQWYTLSNEMLLEHLSASKNYGEGTMFADGSYYYVMGVDLNGKAKKEVYDVLLFPKKRLFDIVKGEKKYSNIDDYLATQPKSLGKIGNSDLITFKDFYNAINPRADIGQSLSSGEKITGQYLREKIGKILDPNNTAGEGAE
jgi:hypothetical protein